MILVIFWIFPSSFWFSRCFCLKSDSFPFFLPFSEILHKYLYFHPFLGWFYVIFDPSLVVPLRHFFFFIFEKLLQLRAPKPLQILVEEGKRVESERTFLSLLPCCKWQLERRLEGGDSLVTGGPLSERRCSLSTCSFAVGECSPARKCFSVGVGGGTRVRVVPWWSSFSVRCVLSCLTELK